MNRTRRLSSCNQSWYSLRKKEIDRFLIPRRPQQSTGLSRHAAAINALISTLSVQAPQDTIQENAQLVMNSDAIHQMAAITAEIIAPLFVDMPDYAGDYIHIFEN